MASHRHSSERLHTRCGWLEVALEEECVPALVLDRFEGHRLGGLVFVDAEF
jgi:hypothetical protein